MLRPIPQTPSSLRGNESRSAPSLLPIYRVRRRPPQTPRALRGSESRFARSPLPICPGLGDLPDPLFAPREPVPLRSELVTLSLHRRVGAHDQNRTDDLVLTKDALCRLSYVGVLFFAPRESIPLRSEPAASLPLFTPRPARVASPFLFPSRPIGPDPIGAGDGIRTRDIQLGRLELYQLSYARLAPSLPGFPRPQRPASGGEGRIRTFEGRGPSDLQSDAFDRFATSPPAVV